MLWASAELLHWVRSSYSGGNGNCVEVASVVGGVVARDSKDPGGPVLVFDRRRWADFVAGLNE